jgi:hypothetical protein
VRGQSGDWLSYRDRRLSHVIPSVNRQDDVRLAAETDVGRGVFFPLRSPHCSICGMLAVGERL